MNLKEAMTILQGLSFLTVIEDRAESYSEKKAVIISFNKRGRFRFGTSYKDIEQMEILN